MLSDMLMWNKIGRVVTRLSEKLDIDPVRALDIFYRSQVCKDLHTPETDLYTRGDIYILNDLLKEIRMGKVMNKTESDSFSNK